MPRRSRNINHHAREEISWSRSLMISIARQACSLSAVTQASHSHRFIIVRCHIHQNEAILVLRAFEVDILTHRRDARAKKNATRLRLESAAAHFFFSYQLSTISSHSLDSERNDNQRHDFYLSSADPKASSTFSLPARSPRRSINCLIDLS